MAKEFKLSYTASEVDARLAMVDQLTEDVEQIESNLSSTVSVIRGGTGLNSVTTGNFLLGNGTEPFVEMAPSDVLTYINGVNYAVMTTAEYEAIGEENANANTLYMLSDTEEEYVLQTDFDALQEEVDAKANTSELSNYYTKIEIDDMELITVDEIDTICASV